MSLLFKPMTIGGVRFRNRVVMPPMVRGVPSMDRAVVGTDGSVTEAVLEHYRRPARAGTGMIIIEATAVDPEGRAWQQGLNAWSDDDLPGLARLAASIKAGGAVANIQLVHGGPQGSSRVTGLPTVGPSSVAPSAGKAAPRTLSTDEILAIEQRFEDAAARAVEAGFDAVEIHGAHGFLLDSFLSKKRNRRTDEYGGALAGRMRFLVETCRRVRERIAAHALLGCRISIHNKADEASSGNEGFSSSDLTELVEGLAATGIDLLHVSTDGAFRGYFGSSKPVGQWVKEMTVTETTDMPVIVAGGLRRPEDAERVLTDGIADFAAVGTAMLKDPEWSRRAWEALEA